MHNGNKSSTEDVKKLKKILILRFSSLGDIVMATSLPRVLRAKFPNAQIDMAVRLDYKDLIEWNSNLTNKIYLDKKEGFKGLFKLIKQIRSEHYDLIIDAHRSIRSIIIDFFVPSKKIYFNKRTFKRLMLIYFKINLFKKVDFQAHEYVKPLKKYGIEYDYKGTQTFIPQEVQKKVLNIFKTSFTDYDKNLLIGIIPSAQWPGKRWPAKKFEELVRLICKHLKTNIVIIGGKNDSFCEDIQKAGLNNNTISMAGKLSIIESAAALSECDIVIANDTGMMHVAESVGTDVIGIMGPTRVEFACYPCRPKSLVVELKMWCRPCSKNGAGVCIKFGKRPCLNHIYPKDVYNKLCDYLKAEGKI